MQLGQNKQKNQNYFKSLSVNESGNGMFEMMVFIPLALLILFVGTDIGLSKLDQAMVNDAVREGMHTQLVTSGHSLYKAAGDSIILDHQLIGITATNMADRIASSIISRRTNFLSSNPHDKVSVHVSTVELDIDETLGTVTGYTITDTKTSNLSSTTINAPAKVTFISDQEYLTNKFSANGGQQHAGIIAPTYLTSTNTLVSAPNKTYLKKSVAFLISVEAIAMSINPGWLDLALGSELGFQVKEFELIRN